MSAYGYVPRPKVSTPTLPCRLFPLPERAKHSDPGNIHRQAIVTVHFDGKQRKVKPELEELLGNVFNDELEAGTTYPQEGPMTKDEFASYFLGYDIVVGFFLENAIPSQAELPDEGRELDNDALSTIAPFISDEKNTLPLEWWSQHYAFSYYIKPNYPGRSSHICNGGFIVTPSARGLGLGRIAALSFLEYAPNLGYRASVFNLVYATNESSLRIWQRLGFTIVGRIPGAGRLRRADAQPGEPSEHFVDAWIVFCDFEERRKQLGFSQISAEK